MLIMLFETKVLVVDDEESIRGFCQIALSAEGFSVETVSRGEAALDALAHDSYDLLLLDISLPDMTGWKILDTIKERQEQGKMEKMPAIIVITAYGDPANRLVGKLQGVYSYLVKPFTPTEVEKIVGLALGQAPQ